MKRAEVREFHYIARFENVRSILDLGILSFEAAKGLGPVSFALETAQWRRAHKEVAPGRSVHTYANVYFDAHNPTLSRRRDLNDRLAVLRISQAILDMPGTVVATQNAASDGVQFHPSPAGLAHVDHDKVYAEWWTTDAAIKEEWARIKCAEVLVPDAIPPGYIVGAYASSDAARDALARLAPGLAVMARAGLYF